MTKNTKDDGQFSDWMADRILRGLIGGMLRLPYEKRVPAMGKAVSRGVAPIAGYLKRAKQNIAMIYPNMSDEERDRIARACCDNFGRTLIENYAWQEFGRRLATTRPIGAGLSALVQAKDEGRPVIFVTGHYGNHEAPRQVLTARGYEIGGLYRPMLNPYFNAHYEKTMTSWGGPVFAQGRRGTMGFARHLKRGGMGTLLFDVSASGIPISFLGQTAHTATSAADIALKLDALVIPYFGIRQSDGLSFSVEVEEPIALTDTETMMTDMTKRLEAQIARDPAQWFWVHRRWKKRNHRQRS
ncbi:lysophospholipid acyltransferase family protein [Loktanella sp. S4079]|uniref:lysophospholipid acyltransferase family protein n=1 Tax=Loktanella sp. S4079 TaxID=579483 RepID=UPI00315AC082